MSTTRTLGSMRASGFVIREVDKAANVPMQETKTTMAMAAQQQRQQFQRSRASAKGMMSYVTDLSFSGAS